MITFASGVSTTSAGGGALTKGAFSPGDVEDDGRCPEGGGPLEARAASSRSWRYASRAVAGGSKSSSGNGRSAACSATAVAFCSSQKILADAGPGPGSTTPKDEEGGPTGASSRRLISGGTGTASAPPPKDGATSTSGWSCAWRSAPSNRSRLPGDKARMAAASAAWGVSPTKDEKAILPSV